MCTLWKLCSRASGDGALNVQFWAEFIDEWDNIIYCNYYFSLYAAVSCLSGKSKLDPYRHSMSHGYLTFLFKIFYKFTTFNSQWHQSLDADPGLKKKRGGGTMLDFFVTSKESKLKQNEEKINRKKRAITSKRWCILGFKGGGGWGTC